METFTIPMPSAPAESLEFIIPKEHEREMFYHDEAGMIRIDVYTPEFEDWLTQLSEPPKKSFVVLSSGFRPSLIFRNDDDAMLFKLRWL